MKLPEFKLDKYYQTFAYKAKYHISSSSAHTLSINDLFTMDPSLIERLSKIELAYPPFEGIHELTTQITTLYETIRPEEIRVMHGAEEGIFTFMNVALSPGDHVIVQVPNYQSLYEIAKAIGASVTYWQADEKNRWQFDLDFLKTNIHENTKAVVVTIPNSPTGSSFTKEQWLELIRICKEKNLLLFSDEVYRFSELNPDETLPSACDVYDKAITVADMSKSFALPGLRVGWLASHHIELIEECNNFKDYTSISVNPVTQMLAAAALQNKDQILKRTRAFIKTNLDLIIKFVKSNSSLFHLNVPKAGTTAFVKILFDQDVEAFCLDLFKKKNVLLLPGNKMDYDHKHFRIGLGVTNLEQALHLMQEYIRENIVEDKLVQIV
ncbi:MAG: aminotransferase class I/II-fold pyridoxal phosphate-dependent enzyme [Bacteroidota bacterium]|nr:aminotransferase class I/II-fold pyridoxal phosphate-dependent enzyme [Bacteroidota bacterium]